MNNCPPLRRLWARKKTAGKDGASGGQPILRRVWRYRKIVRYTEQVQRYFDIFGRERVHVVIYDDFAADPAVAPSAIRWNSWAPIPMASGPGLR